MAAIDIVNQDHPITSDVPERMTMYYQGGCYLNLTDDSDVTVLGTYNATGEVAIAACDYGEGRVFISGPHPEIEEDDSRDGIQFYDPQGELWDPESDWPLLREAIRWLTKSQQSETNQESLLNQIVAFVTFKKD
jgi:hypothetical protein